MAKSPGAGQQPPSEDQLGKASCADQAGSEGAGGPWGRVLPVVFEADCGKKEVWSRYQGKVRKQPLSPGRVGIKEKEKRGWWGRVIQRTPWGTRSGDLLQSSLEVPLTAAEPCGKRKGAFYCRAFV